MKTFSILTLSISLIGTQILASGCSEMAAFNTKVNNFLESSEFKFKLLSIDTLIKGDSLSKTIALASIISKEVRDTIMRNYSLIYPSYSFEQNKGYGTVKHKSAICHNGILDLHRKSFKPISTICSKNK